MQPGEALSVGSGHRASVCEIAFILRAGMAAGQLNWGSRGDCGELLCIAKKVLEIAGQRQVNRLAASRLTLRLLGSLDEAARLGWGKRWVNMASPGSPRGDGLGRDCLCRRPSVILLPNAFLRPAVAVAWGQDMPELWEQCLSTLSL